MASVRLFFGYIENVNELRGMEQDTQHFNKLFWFCVCCVAIGVGFLFALCFFPIPKSSERFADNCQGFFQGSIITAAISFLLGGNIPTKKATPTVTATGDSPTINTGSTDAQPVQ